MIPIKDKYKSFVCTRFKCQTVLFDLQIGPYQMLPLRARVDMAAKGYSSFPKAPALLSDCLASYAGHSLEESYSSAEM